MDARAASNHAQPDIEFIYPQERALVARARAVIGAAPIGYSHPQAPGDTVMKPSLALEGHREAVRRIVERHHAANARVFGSVLAGDDGDDSDLDLLVDPGPRMSLFDIGAIRAEVSELLGVPVDVVTPSALPERWRDRVLADAAPV